MVSADLQRRVNADFKSIHIAYALIAFAFAIEIAVLIIGVALGISSGDHFENTKAIRDAASPIGDNPGILSQLGTIEAVNTWVDPMRLLGVAMFFLGIVMVLYTVVRTLKVRAEAFRVAIPAIVESRKSSGSEG